MIRLVTFDLDNTLWNVDGVIRLAESKTNAWLAKRAPEYAELAPDEHRAIGTTVVQTNPKVRHDISRWRELVLRESLKACGYPLPKATELAAGAFAEFLDWRHRVTFFDGALDVLEELSSNYTLAALTNGNADFQRLGLERFFSFGYCAADVGASKPHTAMFNRAIAHAAIAPKNAVHIGDNPVDDVQGATNAGMSTIWVNLDDSPEQVDATATVTRLADLPAAIASLGLE